MRLAVLVALDGVSSGGLAAPGDVEPWLHGALARLGFRVVGSLEEVPPAATLLVHVIGGVAQAVASLRSLGDRVAAREPESALFLAELTHDGPPDESFVAAEHVEAVREALGARERGQAALVAVPGAALEEPFAFTRLVVRAAEDAEDARSARLSEVVEKLSAMPERHAVAQGYAHVRGATDFELGSNEGPSYAPLLGLADGARDAHEWEHAVAGYRAALLVARRTKERASVYARIGAAERGRGELREAKRAYEKAREHLPRTTAASLYRPRRALARPRRLESLRHARPGAGRPPRHPRRRRRIFFAVARALVENSRDVRAAVVALETARQLDPLRDDVLEALRRGYRVLGEWKKLIEVTGVLADGGPSDAERSARRFAQARIAIDKLGDLELGIAFLDAALTEDPTNDEALDVLVEVRTSRGEVEQLGRALEELAARYDEMGDAERAKDARRCIEGLPSARPSQMVPSQVVPTARATGAAAAPEVLATADVARTEPPAGANASIPESEPSLELLDALPSEDDLGATGGHESVPSFATIPAATEANETTGPMVALPPTLEELPPDSLLDYEEEPTEGPSSLVDSLPEPAVEIMGHAHVAHVAAAASLAEAFPEPSLDVPVFEAGETGLHAALVDSRTIPSPGPVDDDSTLLELEESVARTPLDARLHARLFEIHTKAGRVDRAFLSALALEELGAATGEHESLLQECRPEGPLRLRALLDGPAWETLRRPAPTTSSRRSSAPTLRRRSARRSRTGARGESSPPSTRSGSRPPRAPSRSSRASTGRARPRRPLPGPLRPRRRARRHRGRPVEGPFDGARSEGAQRPLDEGARVPRRAPPHVLPPRVRAARSLLLAPRAHAPRPRLRPDGAPGGPDPAVGRRFGRRASRSDRAEPHARPIARRWRPRSSASSRVAASSTWPVGPSASSSPAARAGLFLCGDLQLGDDPPCGPTSSGWASRLRALAGRPARVHCVARPRRLAGRVRAHRVTPCERPPLEGRGRASRAARARGRGRGRGSRGLNVPAPNPAAG